MPVQQPAARWSGGDAGISRGCRCRRRRWSGARHRGAGLPAALPVETESRVRQGLVCLHLNARTSTMNRSMICCGVSPGRPSSARAAGAP